MNPKHATQSGLNFIIILIYLFRYCRISLYTKFLIGAAILTTLIQFQFLHLDNATYSWPCENTGEPKNIPTLPIDCPCDLLMVMAKHGWMGNCRLLRVNGSCLLNDVQVILGMKTL